MVLFILNKLIVGTLPSVRSMSRVHRAADLAPRGNLFRSKVMAPRKSSLEKESASQTWRFSLGGILETVSSQENILSFLVMTHVCHVDARLLAGALGPPAGLEVGADALAGARRVLGELARARVDDGLDLLLRLLRDRDVAVQVLIHKQADKHLERNEIERRKIK